MRLIVFAGSREVAENYQELHPSSCIVMSGQNLEAALSYLHSTENAVLICGPAVATGWRAPVGTRIVFDPSFPDDQALRAQAAARVPPPGAEVPDWRDVGFLDPR